MILTDFYERLTQYKDRGFITFTKDDPPSPIYHHRLWKRLAADIYQGIRSVDDYYVLVHEHILADIGGTQLTEDQVTIFLMECAVEKQSLASNFLYAIERYVIDTFGDRLVMDHCEELENAQHDHDL